MSSIDPRANLNLTTSLDALDRRALDVQVEDPALAGLTLGDAPASIEIDPGERALKLLADGGDLDDGGYPVSGDRSQDAEAGVDSVLAYLGLD